MTLRTVTYDDQEYELTLLNPDNRKKTYLECLRLFSYCLLFALLVGYLDGVFAREELILQCRANPEAQACTELFPSPINAIQP